MPKEFFSCVNALLKEGKAKDSAYAICTDAYKKRHGGRSPQEDHVKNSFAITVDFLEGVQYVEQKELIPEKGVSVILAEGKIKQYVFDFLNENAKWTEESAAEFVRSALEKWNLSSVIQAEITVPVQQAESYLDTDTLNRLKAVDNDPFFVPIHIKYGTGSNKQHFDQAFFDKAGPKFEKTPFLFNHSDLNEFGNGNPIGSIVKFVGTDDKGATFMAYVSASESKLRQKIRESQALQDRGFVKKVSIEGIPTKSDFTVDEKTGIKYFHDLAMPTGIAIVNKEGLKGSQII